MSKAQPPDAPRRQVDAERGRSVRTQPTETGPSQMFDDPFTGCLYTWVSALTATAFGIGLALSRRNWALRLVVGAVTLSMAIMAFGATVELQEMERENRD